MRGQHFKIFVHHANAVNRLAKEVEKAGRNGVITERREASMLDALEEHEQRFERLIDQIERAGVE